MVDFYYDQTLIPHMFLITWWRHQTEIFSESLALCAGNSPLTGEFPSQRPVTRSFGVFFYLRPNKQLSKQSWCWWFETPSCPLWRLCNEIYVLILFPCIIHHSFHVPIRVRHYFLQHPADIEYRWEHRQVPLTDLLNIYSRQHCSIMFNMADVAVLIG